MTLILFILIFGVVVIAHEFGHFLLAKANGIHVVEFAVGMGPNLISTKKGGTKYSLKLFPIGGACMFEGEDGLNEKEGEPGEGSFNKASVWARISTVVAGPFFNLILAFIVAFFMVNMSDVFAIRDAMAVQVAEGGGAEAAGLQAGDRILSINGEKVRLYQEISLYMQVSYRGGDLEIVYERGGERFTTTLTPQYDEEMGTYLLGVVNGEFLEPKGIDTLKYAWYEIRYSVKATYKSLGMLFRGQVGREDVAGPVGIAVNVVGKTYDEAKDYGWQSVLISMLNIVLMLSVNLGILNMLPVPALDGGRLVFLLLEVIRGKPVPPEKEGMVHFVGLVFFMVLMVFIFFNDLANIFMH
ncbi:MAG: RIP metalloprotease RseP [Eubacterium sp.]|nr:RIP metalloprotease RseP [Eubacterium sp.]MCM1217136.1 RIP metalloprotease RseP [Lachnospiraceae bacterium]MCM1240342.1 RIP metalloprotease RseP [Lachnospiraceae bacterium]MCM1303716.1 RIP metalloprotease RseP [Butyrivibrio sp.]MCM1410687.1 RIP metalloprotease RseP [Lachnospiraceae bacterium]